MSSPEVYLVFGTRDSGRRSLLLDLLEDFNDADSTLYFRDSETPAQEIDSILETKETLHGCDFALNECKITHAAITLKCTPSKIFFLPDQTRDPADCIEALKAWLKKNQCQLTRIITLAHCQKIFESEAIDEWHQACIHFSDFVLVNQEDTVDKKWLNKWLSEIRKQFHPTRFEFIKKNKVHNPSDLLDHRVYRNSLFFDNTEEVCEHSDEEEIENYEDKYLRRLLNGKRACVIPRIT